MRVPVLHVDKLEAKGNDKEINLSKFRSHQRRDEDHQTYQ